MLLSPTGVNSADRTAETSITTTIFPDNKARFLLLGECMLPWWQALDGRHLGTVFMNSHSRENPTGFPLKFGIPKGLRSQQVTHRTQLKTPQDSHGLSLATLATHTGLHWGQGRSAKMGTGWLCRTELRAAPRTPICIARSTALGRKKFSC